MYSGPFTLRKTKRIKHYINLLNYFILSPLDHPSWVVKSFQDLSHKHAMGQSQFNICTNHEFLHKLRMRQGRFAG